MFSIWRARDGEKKIEKFDRSRKPLCSRIMEYKELALQVRQIDAGGYFIVPSTKKANEYGTFYLNVYSSMDVKMKYLTPYEGED